MNYFNIFIIIFTIDVIIYLIEGIVYFAYGSKLFEEDFNKLIIGKLKYLGSLFYPTFAASNTPKQNEIFELCKNAEIKYNKEQKIQSILYFSLSILLLLIIIITYLWIVNKLSKTIDYKKSAIVVSIVVLFIIILEITAIFITLQEYGPNSYDLTLFIDNKLIYLLTA